MIAIRRDLSRCGRRETEQRFDGAARAAAGAEFEHLTEQDEGDDDGGGLVIDRHKPVSVGH
jgi:hypothetical protein